MWLIASDAATVKLDSGNRSELTCDERRAIAACIRKKRHRNLYGFD